MGSRERKRGDRCANPESKTGPPQRPTRAERLRPWLLAATIALFVARVLFPSESAALKGDGQLVVMLWCLVAMAWVLGSLGQPEFRIRFGWTDASVGLLIGWHTLAALFAVRNGSPRPALNMLWEWLALGISFFLVRQLLTGRREGRAAVTVMISVAVALSTYGLYQYFYELPATRAFYEQHPAEALEALRAAGMELGEDTAAKELFDNRIASVEPFATFALANSLAAYLAPWLVVACAVAVVGFPAGRPKTWIAPPSSVDGASQADVPIAERSATMWRLGIVCLMSPIIACLLLTKSRAGQLATCFGLALVAILWWRARREGGRMGWKPVAVIGSLVVVLALGVWGATAVGGLDVEVLSEAPKSLGYRVQYWQSTARMIAEHPWLGCGPGQFQHTYTLYKLPEASEEIADPHNFVLEVWATAGTPAAIALLALLATFAWSLFRRRSPSEDGLPRAEDTENSSAGDAPGFVLCGGIAGVFLAVPVALASFAPSGEVAVAVGVLPAILAAVMLKPWIVNGQMPRGVPAIGLVVLLTGLLFSGGIGAPGVAGTLWILLALGLNLQEQERARTLPPWAAGAALVAAVGLAVSCYATSYRPVFRCREAINAANSDMAEARRHFEKAAEARRHFEEAAAADRLSFEPLMALAGIAHARWVAAPTSAASRTIEEYGIATLKLSPKSASNWHYFARMFHDVGWATGDPKQVQLAVRAYRRAVDLYPTNCRYRAELAEILHQTGDIDGASREAAEALRLDEITPHTDKKLLAEQRNRLSRNIFRTK